MTTDICYTVPEYKRLLCKWNKKNLNQKQFKLYMNILYQFIHILFNVLCIKRIQNVLKIT